MLVLINSKKLSTQYLWIFYLKYSSLASLFKNGSKCFITIFDRALSLMVICQNGSILNVGADRVTRCRLTYLFCVPKYWLSL